ncbi:hypothetical protein Pmani_034974 [Petrolisthes manimaculis]|uniref:Uncharacterized protein n=1 Tax=Petrolisthes manimaculis TaxID=1843537 RepID=A0AAE1NLN9_9EUCA|nr:hypothetical protein Pmani_034974 [Petrolisthes manimaculis]
MLRPPPSLMSGEGGVGGDVKFGWGGGGQSLPAPTHLTQFAIPPAFPRLRPVRFEPRVIMQASPCGNKSTQTPLTPD